MILQDDKSVSSNERYALIIELLFGNEDGSVRKHPDGEELAQCLSWFVNGWNHDKSSKEKSKKRLIDFDVDQFRILADFRSIYGIDLKESYMHFWEFMGLLWNMPYKSSSLMQVIEIRQREINPKMGKEEKKSIAKAQEIYGLDSIEEKELSIEEVAKIDEFDRMMEEIKKNKR